MKVCPKCGIEKPRSDFHKNNAKPDGLQNYCKPCKASIELNQYHTNPVRKKKLNDRTQMVRQHHTVLMRRFKRFKGCLICGEKEPVALDLHHLDASQKDKNPSAMVTFSTKKFKAEIRKCVVLCSNCHRKVHAGILSL